MLDCRYDRILRTDEDVFLTPRLLTWTPPHDFVFGQVCIRRTSYRHTCAGIWAIAFHHFHMLSNQSMYTDNTGRLQ